MFVTLQTYQNKYLQMYLKIELVTICVHSILQTMFLFFCHLGYPSILCWFNERLIRQGPLQISTGSNQYSKAPYWQVSILYWGKYACLMMSLLKRMRYMSQVMVRGNWKCKGLYSQNTSSALWEIRTASWIMVNCQPWPMTAVAEGNLLPPDLQLNDNDWEKRCMSVSHRFKTGDSRIGAFSLGVGASVGLFGFPVICQACRSPVPNWTWRQTCVKRFSVCQDCGHVLFWFDSVCVVGKNLNTTHWSSTAWLTAIERCDVGILGSLGLNLWFQFKCGTGICKQ